MINAVIMSSSSKDAKKFKTTKVVKKERKTPKIMSKSKSNSKSAGVYISQCICHKNMWCEECYGEYDLFD